MFQQAVPGAAQSVVILYTELAGYFLSCVQALAEQFPVKVHVIHYPVNKVAPFQFSASHPNITFYDRQHLSTEALQTLVQQLNPDLLYCAGWSDKGYLEVVKTFKGKTKTLLGFDNQWHGTMRQRLSVIYARLFIKPLFDVAFVPGNKQKVFARKLGFPEKAIRLGAYSADVPLFASMFGRYKEKKQAAFPKRFIFVGRYVNEKGLGDLFDTFTSLAEQHKDWELWCLGTGPLRFPEHPAVRHMGFVQPSELETYIAQTGVLVLPSHFEPWGVVVHEFAAAGFPMILSDRIGAGEAFLQEGLNAYGFEAGKKDLLRQSLERMMQHSDTQLAHMAEQSHQQAMKITPSTWASTLYTLLNKNV